MSTHVIFGFGNRDKIVESLKLSSNYFDSLEIFITGGPCFSSYLAIRLSKKNLLDKPVFYKVKTNIELMQKLVDWINSINVGLTVTIVSNEHNGYYFGYDYADYHYIPKDFKFNKPARYYKEQLDKLKGLEVSDIILEVQVHSSTIKPRLIVEYMCLVLLRMLDPMEGFIFLPGKFNPDKLIDSIIKISNKSNNIHNLSTKFTVTESSLIKILSASILEKVSGINDLDLEYLYSPQSRFFSLILGGNEDIDDEDENEDDDYEDEDL